MVSQFVAKGFREEGYAVDQAFRGDDAWRLLCLAPYDLVVLDIMLPGLGGLELLKRLRGQGYVMPVLLLTAKADVEDRVRGLDMGADDYVPKPFAFAELLARVKALLRRYTAPADGSDSMLSFADVSIDPISRRVTRAGRDIELTAKEYALLDFMVRNQGRVLTRTTIIEHVWDRHFDSDTNLVDVYVQRLRRKLEESGVSRLVHTRRGMGYVLREGE